MIQKEDLEKIKDIVKEFFERTTFEVGIDFLPEEEGVIPIRIKTEDPQILIGKGGQALSELQHVIKVILRKKINTPFYIDLDINDYKKRKIEYLKELAKNIADEVAMTGREKQLPVMTAYERRVIHLELTGRQDVVAESIGSEPERWLVIKPRS